MPVDGWPIMARQKSVFNSVFPSSRLRDIAPTPAATPVLDQGGFGQSFEESTVPSGPPLSPDGSDAYPEQIIWDRAWHSATSFLILPATELVTQNQAPDLAAFAAHYDEAPRHTTESIRYLTSKKRADSARERKTERESIILWYTDHVRGHFLAYPKPALCRVSPTAYCPCSSADLLPATTGERCG